MNRPLHAEIGLIKARMGQAKPSGSSVRHFVFFDIDVIHFLIGRCPHGQPNNNTPALTLSHTNYTEDFDRNGLVYDVVLVLRASLKKSQSKTGQLDITSRTVLATKKILFI